MNAESRAALIAAVVLTAPATFAIGAGALRAATGIGGPAALVDAGFAAFGVSNSSPLPTRQASYFFAYILTPAVAAALAIFASAALAPRMRWPFFAVSAAAALSAVFWVVYSLADA